MSQIICLPCARKANSFCQFYELLNKAASQCPDSSKRKFSTPTGKSPRRKSLRLRSPAHAKPTSSRKALFDSPTKGQPSTSTMDTNLNIEDLDPTSIGFAIKLCIAYKSGNVVVNGKFENEDAMLIKALSLKKWMAATNILLRHRFLRAELLDAIEKEMTKEVREYSKTDNCLKSSDPEHLTVFSNSTLCQELSEYSPILHMIFSAACGLSDGEKNTRESNALALAASTLLRCSNPTMSALAYRESLILYNSGVSYENFTRLNNLGICMSSASTIALHKKINENFDYKVQLWKRQIEENRSIVALLEEVNKKQMASFGEDDMVLELPLNVNEDNLVSYHYYTPSIYKAMVHVLETVVGKKVDLSVTEDDITLAIEKMKAERLPFYKIVADNIDHNIQACVQTKSCHNRSVHWTHQFALKEQAIELGLESELPQKSVDDLNLIELLPNQCVQDHFVQQWAVLVSRVITKYIPAFNQYKTSVIYHIPHKYSKEMSMKSELCSLSMEFHNPNVAGDMAQILKNYQDKYVPTSVVDKKDVLTKVPIHGDQLFEERSRNVKWTYQVADSKYDKFSNLLPEHADWHAKVTLYKILCDLFVDDNSVAEIGTSKASMVRTDKPTLNFPEPHCSRQTKMEWLLQVCKDYVMKFVLAAGVNVLVNKTTELERSTNEGFACRFQGCMATFTYHSRRVRHELEKHNLHLLPPFEGDERDEFGYYICRSNCGLCFKTKSTRNRSV
ncbi:uncharacterized protein LOC111327585 isoform X2 [Stylophora pistillata]|uniref:uncharacterized protein LOC111327585 isoform X2 n=1 Tax=Stylophora pistillata TaxID=50429 RepID=UPI000C040846|nr:uncharacterized protein LOC111327585 isoform X2 [Stylophora pistillata]